MPDYDTRSQDGYDERVEVDLFYEEGGMSTAAMEYIELSTYKDVEYGRIVDIVLANFEYYKWTKSGQAGDF